MYPQRELTRLAAYKSALRRDIAVRRAQCASAAARAVQPLALLDRTVTFWRRLSPFVLTAALPLGFVAVRRFFPRLQTLGGLVRWVPLALDGLRGMRSLLARVRTGAAPSNSP